MLSLYDGDTIRQAVALSVDSGLRAILTNRLRQLVTEDYDLTEMTHILVVCTGDTEEQIVRETGFSPLVNPADGSRYGSPTFSPHWVWLSLIDGFYHLILTIGNSGFAVELFIEDQLGVDPDLLAMCRTYLSDEGAGS